MGTNGSDKLEAIFLEACELPSDEREAFLQRACAGDPELYAQVKAYLAADDNPYEIFSGSPTQTRGQVGHGWSEDVAHTEAIPESIAGYKISHRLGEGATAVVYLAEQPHVCRPVALKVLKISLVGASTLRRFQTEAQALGRLIHPGIGMVYDAGTSIADAAAIPYVVMEYVPNARTLVRYAEEEQLGVRARMALFLKACDAVCYIHQERILHRDLKPTNILVDTVGNVKIIDFGLAKLVAEDGRAQMVGHFTFGAWGTPPYTSPEQIDFADLDERTDVYSLGAVLYELLCGVPPFRTSGLGLLDVARMIKSQMPPRPSTVNPDLSEDAERIVLKAMEKDREDRYRSATDLSADIKRFLGHHSGEGLLSGLTEPTHGGAATDDNVRQLFDGSMHESGSMPRCEEEARESRKGEMSFRLNLGSGKPGEELRSFQHACSPQWFQASPLVAFLPDGRHMIAVTMEGLAQLWDTVTGAAVRQFETPAPRSLTPMDNVRYPVSMAVSHKGDFIVTAFGCEHMAGMWDVARGVGVQQFQGPPSGVQAVAISPDDRCVLVSGSEGHGSSAHGVIIFYDVASGREDRRFAAGRYGFQQAIFSRDGRQVLTCGDAVHLWDSQTGEELQAFPAPGALAAAFLPDMRYVVTGDATRSLRASHARLWDLFTTTEVRRFEGHEGAVTSLAMSPNGQHLLTGDSSGSVRLWDVATGSRLWEASGGNRVGVGSAAFSPDGRYALTGSRDSTARLWFVGDDW